MDGARLCTREAPAGCSHWQCSPHPLRFLAKSHLARPVLKHKVMKRQRCAALIVALTSLMLAAGCATGTQESASAHSITIQDGADRPLAPAERLRDGDGRSHFEIPCAANDAHVVLLLALDAGVVHVADQRLAVQAGSTVQLPVGVPYLVEGTEVDALVVEND